VVFKLRNAVNLGVADFASPKLVMDFSGEIHRLTGMQLNFPRGIKTTIRFAMFCAVAALNANLLSAQTNDAAPSPATNSAPPVPLLQIKADQVTCKVSPMLYGLMTEEINFSYEGGLYGELVRNRTFKADAIQQPISATNYDASKYYPVKIAVSNAPKYWTAVNAVISLDTNTPLNAALNVSCKVDLSKATVDKPAGIMNDGYWGIALRPNTTYRVSFYAKAKHFDDMLKVSLMHVVSTTNITIKSASSNSVDFDWHTGGAMTTVASVTIPKLSGKWERYTATLTTSSNIEPSKENRLVISTTKSGTFMGSGTIWFQQVSLFPPTYNNRENGNRPDIMQLLADMHPKFLRLPGGNYVEGDYFNERFNWKETIGPVEKRPGHRSCWNYWSTDGLGLLEYAQWCEDLKMEPVLAVFAGYVLKHQSVPAGPALEPYVQEALEEIEYLTGDENTKWGAQRTKDGHPAPFPLHYVEIGNEDWFDGSGGYDKRFSQFYDAIKAKYPQLQIISTVGNEHPESQRVHSRVPDLVDEHYYPSTEAAMQSMWNTYDKRSRTNQSKIFVGEWATRVGQPTPNMAGALGDAAWMCGMERNSDIVVLESYAPLFVNVSDVANAVPSARSMQWRSDLIGYDALTSYGSPSYYAQVMFSTHHGDDVLATESQNIPTYTYQAPVRTRGGVPQGGPPPPRELPQIYYDATRDSSTGTIYLKVVNRQSVPQSVHVQINGARSIDSSGTATVMKANSPDDTNSIQEPKKIVPVTETVDGLGSDFTREFPPYSITVLEIKS
jgi:alpha-N-arabinofuranosidase